MTPDERAEWAERLTAPGQRARDAEARGLRAETAFDFLVRALAEPEQEAGR